MKKLVSRGVVFLAGAVSLPVSMPQPLPGHAFVGYRQDPRLNILRRFFAEIGCPALRYAPAFLEAADDFALDWRLLPSLSYVESTGGKAARNNNFFGWDSGRAKFSSPAAGIQTVAYRLSHGERYHDKTLDEKLAIYNPKSGYARKVKSIMRRIAPSE
jgi:hypothetical protein